jgi:hypothetical protein
MTGHPTVLRRVTNALVRHTSRVLPASCATWATAMHEEVRNISDDGEALRWALGCLRTGYSERFRVMKLLDLRVVRWGMALWMSRQGISCLFDGCLVLSYKLQLLGITGFLGGQTEGDDYRRFIPVMDATRVWESAVSLLAAVLYIAVVVQILRRNRFAFALFTAAITLNLGLWIHDLSKPQFVQAFSSAHLQRDAMLYLITALLGVLLWQDKQVRQPLSK